MKKACMTVAASAVIALLSTVALPQAHAEDCNLVVTKGGSTIKTKDGANLQVSGAKDCDAAAAAEVENTAPAAPVAQVQATPPATPAEPVVITIDGDLAFGFDQAEISPSFEPQLRAIAQRLKAMSATDFTVIGYTDNVGSETYNQTLSERRAEAVAAFLINAGINPADLQIQGRGEADPIDSNDTDVGRANNRRVEIHTKPA